MAARRVLLKLTGEAFGASGSGIDLRGLERVAGEIVRGVGGGCQLAVVVGAGNFLRGARLEGAGLDRIRADRMGMVATVLNALALEAALGAAGVSACVLSAVEVRGITGPADPRFAAEALGDGRVVLFAGGLGQPLFTTDTTAAVRAIEIGAEVLLKATKVDGVYAADPEVDRGAERFERIAWAEAVRRRLAVMDAAAFQLCWEHRLPIRVFSGLEAGQTARAILGEPVGTLVEGGPYGL